MNTNEERIKELEAQLVEAIQKGHAMQDAAKAQRDKEYELRKAQMKRAEAAEAENRRLREALQGLLDWYEDTYGDTYVEGFCECDSSVDYRCRACLARNALAQEPKEDK